MSRRREREPERVWVAPPAPELECSVRADVFADPVTLACGHTFCRACAVSWFDAPAKRCPAARCPASKGAKPATLPSQYALKGMVEALRVYCRFGLREDERGEWTPDAHGCGAQLRRAEVAAHEAACEHALETCPFAGCGVQRRRRDADAHDAEAAVAHARGERDARLALEAAARDARLASEARLGALEASMRSQQARSDALEARLAAAVGASPAVLGAVGASAAAGAAQSSRVITGAARRATLRGHTGVVYAVAWSPDGSTLSCSDNKTLKLWNVATLECTATLEGHGGAVSACAWSRDGRTIASGSDDKTVKLWSADTRSCWGTLAGHTDAVVGCSFSHDGRSLASHGLNGDLKLWDLEAGLEDGRCTATFGDRSNSLCCAWNHDLRLVAVGGMNGNVSVWDVASGSCVATLSGHMGAVKACAWSWDGCAFLTASFDNTLKVWSAAAPFRCTATLSGHTDAVLSCAWSPDCCTIVSTSLDGTLRLWNAATGSAIFSSDSSGSPIWACAWSADGRTIATGSREVVSLWDVHE